MDEPPSAEGVPEPPWWSSPSRSATRTPLSRETIVDAALAVLDREGLDGLSMRRVAEELGVGAASLYWHVANKEQLLHVLLDRVISEIPLPEPDPARWREQLEQLAYDGRAAFARHRDLARASMGRVPMGPGLVRIVEWQLALLRGAGVPTRPAAWLGDLLALYIAAHAYEETVEGDEPSEGGGEAIGRYLAALPPERFPHLLAAAPELAAGDREERFAFGLGLILDGLAARVADGRDVSS